MHRPVTALVVAGVVLLGLLAAADALRRRSESKPLPKAGGPTTTRPPTLEETLRRDAVAGIITYSDERCVLHSLVLPNLTDEVVRQEATDKPVRRCRFSEGAGRYLADDELISPNEKLVARCRRGHVEVIAVLSNELRARFPGCTPAWDADGRLTYARDGQVLAAGRVLYWRSDLRRIARRYPNVAGLGPGIPFRVTPLALAWLDRLLLAISVRVDIRGVEPQHFVALLRGKRLLAMDAAFAGAVRSLIVSSTGSFVAEDQGRVLTKEGRSYGLLERLPRPSAVAFSPDERWLALATGNSIFITGTPRELGRVIRLPSPAQDLVWEPGGPSIDTTTTAR